MCETMTRNRSENVLKYIQVKAEMRTSIGTIGTIAWINFINISDRKESENVLKYRKVKAKG